jgi:predicted secreted protein
MTRRRWIALVVLVALGAGLLVTMLLVPWSDDAPATKAPAIYEQGDEISVASGDEFIVALAATPSTGYSWTPADNPDVTFVSSRMVAGGTMPGAPGTQQLTFRAERRGETTLELAYDRSFEPDAPPAKTASFPVTVK